MCRAEHLARPSPTSNPHADGDERARFKVKPELEEKIMNKIKAHLEEKLEWVEFNHKFSQKEDCFID